MVLSYFGGGGRYAVIDDQNKAQRILLLRSSNLVRNICFNNINYKINYINNYNVKQTVISTTREK